ncbi:shufflon system plasmid conjugative transfer pilus tip adhesin PilV [Nitratidesulfovibrio liaohensis]|jgi:hypothetical protein|uniref:Shufflon system plasmid conjugative transfer pilus tip adhesin PilV n=1 Tax=Nitratidesulfovibrio liaohensis TaxID=2604158 RepID=A0ABY9R3M7_9BACT|nr:shufflon system plasmid conjugative transfer pilus tip adhesin PilV [Nitratidesulfovibrio liaohensis]WMW66353.1 shufflon system plasmid conjugative transfer pilus tip adhesin PilV [Nitratidesulfovibrio liaohensis]
MNRKKDAGFATVEMIGALIVLLILLPMLARLADWGMTEVQKRAAATHLARVGEAAAKYAQKHQTTLLSQATASSGPTITLADLRNGEFLPERFGDRNGWGQGYEIHVREPRSGELQVVVLTTGGRGHDADSPGFGLTVVPSAAALVEGAGGFVPTGDIAGQSSSVLRGAYGAWEVDLSGAGIANPGAGHLGYLANFDASSLGQDFLYRVAVPGSPDLNAMQTELDMTDHAIRGVREVQFSHVAYEDMTDFCASADDDGRTFLDRERGLYLCRNGEVKMLGDSGNSVLMQKATLAKAGDRITKPTCPPGTATHPEIFVAPSLIAPGEDAPPMTSVQAWATSISDTEWEVHLRLLTTDDSLGWVQPEADYGRIIAFATCAPDEPTPTP